MNQQRHFGFNWPQTKCITMNIHPQFSTSFVRRQGNWIGFSWTHVSQPVCSSRCEWSFHLFGARMDYARYEERPASFHVRLWTLHLDVSEWREEWRFDFSRSRKPWVDRHIWLVHIGSWTVSYNPNWVQRAERHFCEARAKCHKLFGSIG